MLSDIKFGYMPSVKSTEFWEPKHLVNLVKRILIAHIADETAIPYKAAVELYTSEWLNDMFAPELQNRVPPMTAELFANRTSLWKIV